jgi:origin recognition complex subunit 3
MIIFFSFFQPIGVKNEIPTGVFITGVNMPDHDAIFSQLQENLFKITPYVSRLCSKSCPNIRLIVKEATSQIMETQYGSDEEVDPELAKFNPRKGNMTFGIFKQWYELREAGEGDDKRPVVFILEDFESFQPRALQDFVSICSLYVDKFPIVLLFGIATIPAVVHQLLPRSISSCLCIEKFHAQPAITYLLEVIDRIFISTEFAFKLGPNVFQYLYENFLFHDFSLQNFIFGLKFCMMDHFYSNPLSVLCSASNIDVIHELSHEQLEVVRKSSSFRRYAEQQDAKERRLLLLDDEHTIDVVSEKLEDMNSYHHHFFPALRCLASLVSKLPGYPMGKKCRDVYEHCLKTSVKELDLYHQALKMATFLAKDELVPVLEECVELLSFAIEQQNAICGDFEEYVQDLKSALLNFKELSKQNASITSAAKSSDASPKVVSSVTSRFELQEKLKNAVYKRKKESPFEKTRESAITTLDKMFQKYLSCPAEQTLHEIFYYDQAETVKQRLSGCPRVAIQTALNNPRYYLNCTCCEIEAGSIQDTLPDISVAFMLHLECGRLINLYDWLQAFTTVTEPPAKKATRKAKNDEQQALQARFIQAVSELQFLGFIKATKRKTDHVARLTWGSC